MSFEEELAKGVSLNVQRKEAIYKCPKCGKRMERLKRWVLMQRLDGKIVFRKMVRPVGNTLLNEFTCSNCNWQGTAWDALKKKNLTMFGTRKRKKSLQRYPFELFAKAVPHDKSEDRS